MSTCLLTADAMSILGFLLITLAKTSKFLFFSLVESITRGSNCRFLPVPFSGFSFGSFAWNFPNEAVAFFAT